MQLVLKDLFSRAALKKAVAGSWNLRPPVLLTITLLLFWSPPSSTGRESPTGDQEQSGKAPLTATQFWAKIARLLNERNGSVTKRQFEQAFGVKLKAPVRERDATTYTLSAHVDSYFDASLTFFAPVSGQLVGRETNRAYVVWHLDWTTDTFSGTGKQGCITADTVRSSLIATGWTSPWLHWGIWEEQREREAEEARRLNLHPEPLPFIQPAAIFRLRVNEEKGRSDRLPYGRIFTAGDGDHPDSCVLAIRVVAAR